MGLAAVRPPAMLVGAKHNPHEQEVAVLRLRPPQAGPTASTAGLTPLQVSFAGRERPTPPQPRGAGRTGRDAPRAGRGDDAREYLRLYWQVRLRAARRLFNDPE